jgi:branched-chain amino acid transport system substrate-binding protein
MKRLRVALWPAIGATLIGLVFPLGNLALAQSAPPIKVGVIGPFKLTPGRDIQEASTMAAEEINAAGGVLGRKLELVFAETEQNPEKGKTAVERLLFVDKVDVIIGEHRSEVALAVQPIIVENKKIFLSTGTGSPLLSDRVLQDYDKYKYYFRTFLNSNQMAEQMVKQLSDMMTTYNKDKVAVITETAVWAEPIVQAVKNTLGPKLVALEQVSTNAKDLSVELSRVRNANVPGQLRCHCWRPGPARSVASTWRRQIATTRTPAPLHLLESPRRPANFQVSLAPVRRTLLRLAFASPMRKR